MLHPDFCEFGACGRKRDRAEIIAALTGERPPAGNALATVAGIAGIRLAGDVVHVTHLSRGDHKSALRSSAWLRAGAGWRLYFRQGTPAQIS